MKCQKCGTENETGSKFCIGCGQNIENQAIVSENLTKKENENAQNKVNNVKQTNVSPQTQAIDQNISAMQFDKTKQNNPNNQINTSQPIVNNTQVHSSNNKIPSFNFLAFLIVGVIKPKQVFEQEESKLESFKNSAILAIITVFGATIIGFIMNMILTLINSEFEFKYLQPLFSGKNLLATFIQVPIYNLVTILAAAGIFYVVALVMKKQEFNYSKVLAILSLSLVPFIVGIVVVPIFSKIYYPLGIIISGTLYIYSVILIYELVNDIVSFGDKKILYNFVAFALVIALGTVIYNKIALEMGINPRPGANSKIQIVNEIDKFKSDLEGFFGN